MTNMYHRNLCDITFLFCFQIVLSCFIVAASAGFLGSYSPYSHAIPSYSHGYIAPIATSYANTYKVSHSIPVIKTYAAPVYVGSFGHGLGYSHGLGGYSHGYSSGLGYGFGSYHHQEEEYAAHFKIAIAHYSISFSENTKNNLLCNRKIHFKNKRLFVLYGL